MMIERVALGSIEAEPERFQFRDEPWSESTVAGIVREGIDLARFDPLPVVRRGERCVVAGDGHSRLEALRRLAGAGRLPAAWGDLVPVRIVSEADALRLAYVANMSRSPFRAVEEAKIFAARVERGESVEAIAGSSHVSEGYVRKRMKLNALAPAIRKAVGEPWGIDVDKAIVLAEGCERYGIDVQTQTELWHKVISQGDWTQRSLKLLLERIGPKARGESQGLMFELPANVGELVREAGELAKARQRARRGMQWLLGARAALGEFPDLVELLDREGEGMLARIRAAEAEDAEALGALVA